MNSLHLGIFLGSLIVALFLNFFLGDSGQKLPVIRKSDLLVALRNVQQYALTTTGHTTGLVFRMNCGHILSNRIFLSAMKELSMIKAGIVLTRMFLKAWQGIQMHISNSIMDSVSHLPVGVKLL